MFKRILLVFLFVTIMPFDYNLFFDGTGRTNLAYAAGQDDLESIKKDLTEIKKELQEIKRLLRLRSQKPARRQAPSFAEMGIENSPTMGEEDAPITIVEFSDYQCPFCKRFYNDTLPLLKKEYIETGKLKYVFKDFPLSFHKDAQKAAEAARCAGDQERYWEMHNMIFENQGDIKVDALKGFARKLGLKMEEFGQCLDGDRYSREVKANLEDGLRVGVRGTPTFILGKSKSDGKVKGMVIIGAQPYQTFKERIDALLKNP